jgi:hypothetical protein
MPAWIVAKYTLVEAHKRSLIYLFLAGVLVSFALAAYAASLAMSEKQATLAAFYSFFVRLCAVALAAGYLILTEMRTLERENIHLWLGLPIGRMRYLLEKSAAYGLLMAGFALLACLPLLWAGPGAGLSLMWGASLFCELLIAVALALLLSLVFRQALPALSIFAVIYLFARGAAELYRHSSNLIAGPADAAERLIAWAVKLITYLVPHLENFAAAEWLLYPGEYGPRWEAILLQTGLYGGLLLVLALERIRRKAF